MPSEITVSASVLGKGSGSAARSANAAVNTEDPLNAEINQP
jgi:hypothetical protein